MQAELALEHGNELLVEQDIHEACDDVMMDLQRWNISADVYPEVLPAGALLWHVFPMLLEGHSNAAKCWQMHLLLHTRDQNFMQH